MKAIIFNRVQCVKLLMRFGSDLTIKNKCLELIQIIILYEEIFCKKDNSLIFLDKLSLIIYVYMYFRTTDRANPLHKLNPDQIKQLTRYIIP